jgi:hypothetical protein
VRHGKINRPPKRGEEFLRQYAILEERKNWRMKTIEQRGGFRWFESANVTRFEDYQAPEEASQAIARLRERRREGFDRAIDATIAESKRTVR